MEKFIFKLAYNSYTIVKIIFILNFMGLIIAHYYIYDRNIPLILSYSFWFFTGTSFGYYIAYHSIKYLRKKGIKDSLSPN
jgi:hypothetical protein